MKGTISSLYIIHIGKEKPEIKDLYKYVVPKWASQWRELGTQLDVAQHLMNIIERDYPKDCKGCCIKLFSDWLDSNPSASWGDVITAVDGISTDGMFRLKYIMLIVLEV